jgi:hypothetical protein
MILCGPKFDGVGCGQNLSPFVAANFYFSALPGHQRVVGAVDEQD